MRIGSPGLYNKINGARLRLTRAHTEIMRTHGQYINGVFGVTANCWKSTGALHWHFVYTIVRPSQLPAVKTIGHGARLVGGFAALQPALHAPL